MPFNAFAAYGLDDHAFLLCVKTETNDICSGSGLKYAAAPGHASGVLGRHANRIGE